MKSTVSNFWMRILKIFSVVAVSRLTAWAGGNTLWKSLYMRKQLFSHVLRKSIQYKDLQEKQANIGIFRISFIVFLHCRLFVRSTLNKQRRSADHSCGLLTMRFANYPDAVLESVDLVQSYIAYPARVLPWIKWIRSAEEMNMRDELANALIHRFHEMRPFILSEFVVAVSDQDHDAGTVAHTEPPSLSLSLSASSPFGVTGKAHPQPPHSS